ncbi:MAG: DUF2291 family protein [Vicinamibacteraceae bacterium]
MKWTRARGRLAVGVLLCGVLHLACKPWTVRPIDKGSDKPFDARTFVDEIWSAKVVPAAKASDVDAATAVLERSAAHQKTHSVMVRGHGVVREVDLASRVGLARVDLEPTDGHPDAAIQIGPLIRGTALRDALEFIRFSDFANQLDYADVASELNTRVLGAVLAGVVPADLDGKAVSFRGAVTLGRARGGVVEIVPVVLRMEHLPGEEPKR